MPTVTLPSLPVVPETVELPEVDLDAMSEVARDGVYVAVGSGVLAFQRAQVARRSVQRRLREANGNVNPSEWLTQVTDAGRSRLDSMRDGVGRIGDVPAVQAFDSQFLSVEERMDTILDAVESKLPTPAQFALATTRETAKDTGAQVRTFVGLEV